MASKSNYGKPINGQAVATKILDSLRVFIKGHNLSPELNIFLDKDNTISSGYVEKKLLTGKDLGISVLIHTIDKADNTDSLMSRIKEVSKNNPDSGIMVQLPLSDQFDTEAILTSIPSKQDVDVLNRGGINSVFTQPVAGAISELLDYVGYNVKTLIDLPKDSIHVVGAGYLVGQPVIEWLKSIGVNPVIYRQGDSLSRLLDAKIVISGTGQAHIIKPQHVTIGAVLIDAGTTSDSGELLGDIDPACYDKSSFYTPVPGGVGPVTLAVLMRNVTSLVYRKSL